MTPQLLQRDICKDIEECLSDLRYANPIKGDVPITVYRHDTPVIQHKDYSDLEYNDREIHAEPGAESLEWYDQKEQIEDDPFPYVIVRISQGNVKDPNNAQTVDVVFIIGVYDDDPSKTGFDGVLNIISRIYERYAKNPLVHGNKAKIRFDGEQQLFHWVLQDDDTWPYFFGAIQAEFELMPIERESKYT